MILEFWHLWLIVVLLGSTGILHVAVVKWEFRWGTKGWWLYLIFGILCIPVSFFTTSVLLKSSLIIVGTNLLWTVHEIFKQYDRVEKDWFPSGPGHKSEKKRRENRFVKIQNP